MQYVTVDKDVRLEVLDWGGSGLPVVLLARLRSWNVTPYMDNVPVCGPSVSSQALQIQLCRAGPADYDDTN